MARPLDPADHIEKAEAVLADIEEHLDVISSSDQMMYALAHAKLAEVKHAMKPQQG